MYAVKSSRLPKRKKFFKACPVWKCNKSEVKAILDGLKKSHLIILENNVMMLTKSGKFGKTFLSQQLKSMHH